MAPRFSPQTARGEHNVPVPLTSLIGRTRECDGVAAGLLASCASVGVLATSRELLGVTGETVWKVEPLESEDANRLFVERARQRRPQFIPGQDADSVITSLCSRLDRLPLAI